MNKKSAAMICGAQTVDKGPNLGDKARAFSHAIT